MTSLLSEFSMTFNGSATDETVTNVTRARHGPLLCPPAVLTPLVERMAEGVQLEVGRPVVEAVEGAFVIKGQTSTTSSVANAVRDLADDWALLAARYSPFLGAVTLRTTRKNAAGSDVSRDLKVRVLDLPPIAVLDEGDDLRKGGASGIYLAPAAAMVRSFYVVRFRAEYGLWTGTSAETGTQTATTGGATLSTVNTGLRDVGCRIDIGATTGSPTQLTIATGGVTYVTITNPTNGTYADFAYAARGEYPTPTATVVVPSSMRVPSGTTNWTATVSGGTGTVAVTVTWKPEHASW